MRSLGTIASEIYNRWQPMSPHARPYVEAMLAMHAVTDQYGADDGKEIVLRFLSNASSWKGPAARRIKLELRAMLRGVGS